MDNLGRKYLLFAIFFVVGTKSQIPEAPMSQEEIGKFIKFQYYLFPLCDYLKLSQWLPISLNRFISDLGLKLLMEVANSDGSALDSSKGINC